MKRYVVIILVLSFLILSSCIDQLLPPSVDISSNTEQAREKGDVNIKVFIPDYQKLAEQNENRAIAPQTTKIRLSVLNEENIFIQTGDILQLNVNSITSVPGAPASLPGGIWNGTFLAIECKTYRAGSIKIELLDLNNKVITSGVNQADVVITKGQAAQAVFFTTPEIFSGILGSLSKGEMRFWRVTMMGGYSYKLTVNAAGSYPDIVVFNDDGTFREYYSVSSSANAEINFNPAATESCYFGVWADSGAVSSYSVAMSYNFSKTTQDFSGNNFNGWQASASGPLAVPPVIVVKDEKAAFEFDSKPAQPSSGLRASLSQTFNFTEPNIFYFTLFADINSPNPGATYFKLYIDNEEISSYSGLYSWNDYSIIIPAGSHEIKWSLERDNTSYSPSRSNKVWLTDISFVPDVTSFLDMFPKGPKDTYVGGFPIQYSIKALRSDGTLRQSSSGIVYSGTGVNSAGLFTPPATPGTYTVTASFEGKTIKSDTITVHPADFIKKPYYNIANGKTYYGYQGGNWETKTISSGDVTVTYPAGSDIMADGFISIEGESRYTSKAYVYIYKSGNSDLVTSYTFNPGKINLRMWMRFGPGLYKVYFDGIEFNVTNTCTDTGVEGDPRFKFPSAVVQSDDFRITNILTDILYGVNDETEKIKKINDYIVLNTVYDYDSVNFERKPQDALAVLGTRYHIDPQYEIVGGHFLAVCEGYANAASALLRAAGFESRYVSSTPINHGWNNVYTGGSWKFLDVTWNDPTIGSEDSGPLNVWWYKYFLLTTLDGVNGDHPEARIDMYRSVNPVPVIPKMKGMPDGWY
jgi:transglutaminase-like putative cysteine protease